MVIVHLAAGLRQPEVPSPGRCPPALALPQYRVRPYAPARALITIRCRISRSRVRCLHQLTCCSADLTRTKRMVGRLTASQIASASAASFLLRLTILRRHQTHLMAKLGQFVCPIMRCGAGFHAYRRSAYLVDKILKGAKPAELRAQQPIKFDFVINLKTARSLSLETPPTILALADEVIE